MDPKTVYTPASLPGRSSCVPPPRGRGCRHPLPCLGGAAARCHQGGGGASHHYEAKGVTNIAPLTERSIPVGFALPSVPMVAWALARSVPIGRSDHPGAASV
eukprot:4419506-Pyramimonas_sp.AAC.1